MARLILHLRELGCVCVCMASVTKHVKKAQKAHDILIRKWQAGSYAETDRRAAVHIRVRRG